MAILEIEVEDAYPIDAHCDERNLVVTLRDGRRLSVPLWWYPRLLAASPEQRVDVEFMPLGVHWPLIDEDISIASILRGQKAPGATPPRSGW